LCKSLNKPPQKGGGWNFAFLERSHSWISESRGPSTAAGREAWEKKDLQENTCEELIALFVEDSSFGLQKTVGVEKKIGT